MYHWGPAEEETGVKEALRQIKEAYDTGLLYPEFYTLQDPDDIGHFYAAGDALQTAIPVWQRGLTVMISICRKTLAFPSGIPLMSSF